MCENNTAPVDHAIEQTSHNLPSYTILPAAMAILNMMHERFYANNADGMDSITG